MRSRVLSGALLASLAVWISASPAPAETTRVALLPVVVHSSNPDTGYLADGLAEMISSRLERAGNVAILRISNPEGGTTDLHTAVKLARDARADFVVVGAFTQFGAGASLDVRCAPVPANAEADLDADRRIFIQSGTLEEIIPKLDDLADKVARYIGRGSAPARESATGSSAAANANAAAPPVASPATDELLERIRALEQAVFEAGPPAPADAN